MKIKIKKFKRINEAYFLTVDVDGREETIYFSGMDLFEKFCERFPTHCIREALHRIMGGTVDANRLIEAEGATLEI